MKELTTFERLMRLRKKPTTIELLTGRYEEQRDEEEDKEDGIFNIFYRMLISDLPGSVDLMKRRFEFELLLLRDIKLQKALEKVEDHDDSISIPPEMQQEVDAIRNIIQSYRVSPMYPDEPQSFTPT